MAQVRVVTDSTADLPLALQQELHIRVVPLTVHFGDQVLKDGVDISSQEFFRRQSTSSQLPRTSAPAPGEFLAAYEPLVASGADVVSIHLSSKLSGTLQSAQLGAGMVSTGRVETVDSRSASLGVGFIAVGAARLAHRGASLDEVVAWCRSCADRMQLILAIDTLEYLQKNGRIGRAAALLGGVLGVKPILALADGAVVPVSQVRGKSKVLPRALEVAAARVAPGRRVRLAVMHGDAEAEAQAWLQAFGGQYEVVQSVTGVIGPVLGAHTGPGVVGAIFYEDF